MQTAPEVAPVRVLVVDDDAEAVEVMGHLFQSLGCDVRVANDGREAIDVAPRFEPELVVLDIEMPKIDGCQAARTLRQQAWAIGAIFVAYTGATGRQIADRIKKSGFHEYFSKPAPFDRFEALVRMIRGRGGRCWRSDAASARAKTWRSRTPRLPGSDCS